jgi:uncharacterized membrane protein YeiH
LSRESCVNLRSAVKSSFTHLPLWIDLAAVGFGAAQGGAFVSLARDERNFDVLGVAVFSLLLGLGGGILRDILLGQVPAALRNDWYLLTAVLAGFLGMFVADLIGRPNWSLQALDALVVALFVVVGAAKTENAGLPGGSVIILGTITGIGGGVLRDLVAQQPLALTQRDTPYALVALLGAVAFEFCEWIGTGQTASSSVCLVVVIAVRLIALKRGWMSPAPIMRPPVRVRRR